MSKIEQETNTDKLLDMLAGSNADKRRRAAERLSALGERVVSNHDKTAVQRDETRVLWQYKLDVQHMGPERYPVVDPRELVADRTMVELDPGAFPQRRVPLVDGFSNASGIQWKGVTVERRALYVLAKQSRHPATLGDPFEIVAKLAQVDLSGSWATLWAQRDKDAIAATVKSLSVPLASLAPSAPASPATRPRLANAAPLDLSAGPPRKALRTFLQERFTPAEARLLASDMGLDGIIAWHGPWAIVAHELAGKLVAHGYAANDGRFWSLLVKARPNYRHEITALEGRFR